ncbi:MAG: serine/threonine protein kinase [Planctomycetota bacterium]|nr:MAG: serine/threonine protein kinase [Planctomycetota bacterium]
MAIVNPEQHQQSPAPIPDGQWRSVGPYRLEERIGRGGAADVYAAQGPDGAAAVKICHSRDALVRLRLSREVAALRQLRHPGLVRLYAADDEGDPAWYAMEYLGRLRLRDVIQASQPSAPNDLPTLLAAIADQSLPQANQDPQGLRPAVALGLIKTIASAMAHAHSRGIIHRDLKPENIMVRADGTPVVIDVGLAVDVEDQRLTASGVALGTMAYMAPEQHRGTDIILDERCDVYALGQIVSEVLTGMTVRMHDEQYRRRLRRLPRPLQAVIRQATARDRRWRYASMEAMIEDCQRIERGEPLLIESAPWWARFARFVRWHPQPSLLMLLCVMILSTAAFGWWLSQRAGVQWQPSHNLLLPTLSQQPLEREGTWRRSDQGWRSIGPASMRTQHIFPGQIDLQVAWEWRPQENAQSGPAIDIGVVQGRPAGWRVGLLRPDVLVVWRHGQPWWTTRIPHHQQVQLRVQLTDQECRLWMDGRKLAAIPLPAPIPAGALELHAPDQGVFALRDWQARFPKLPGRVAAKSLSHNLLGEAIAAENAVFHRWYAVTQAAFEELADSRAHPGPVLDQWQAVLHAEALRRTHLVSDPGRLQSLMPQFHPLLWESDSLNIWQQRSLAVALADEAALAQVNHAADTAPDEHLVDWARWLLQRRCEYERSATAPARAAIAARLTSDDPHVLLWADW